MTGRLGKGILGDKDSDVDGAFDYVEERMDLMEPDR